MFGLTLIASQGLASTASADQCAPAYVQASVSTPLDGQPVARNAHIRVSEFTGCGEALPGPLPQYRLIGAEGPVAFERVPSRFAHGELAPKQPLPTGSLTIEARDPIGEHELGAWHVLQTVEVVDRIDDAAPRFEGIATASASVVTGMIMLSPCEAEDGPVVETVIDFALADDGPTPHDELLYVLDRRADASAPWQAHRSFRPSVTKSGHGRLSWKDEYGFDESWTYRLRVVDAAGNETIGTATAEVITPSRPEGPAAEVLAMATSPEAAPETVSVPPPMGSRWQWGAAFGTLVGAGLVGLRRRR